MDNNLEHDIDDNTGPFDRAKLERELGKFGKAYGLGQNSRPAAALLCVDAASRLTDVGKDDAAALYERFAKGRAAAKSVEYVAASSDKVQVSKLKRFLELGQLPAIDGVDVMNRTVDTITELSRRAENPLKGSAYDNMVLVARRQIAQPTVELSNDEIEGILTEAPEDKTAIDLVIEQYKRSYRLAEKLVEDHGVTDVTAVDAATADLAQQIANMGGELPAMTKDEKALVKANATITKLGGTVLFTSGVEVDSTEQDDAVLEALSA